ncbi:MFS transporter [Devosia sp.]|uniref:MFS transporter n=1 Tax=Devosia sp. TaxID=1871048 RepID=UPI003266376E
MTEATSTWGDLFRGNNGLRIAVLTGGVGLHAINVLMGETLLPSVVGDIGGLDLFAWNVSIFIVASIIASIFAAIRPFGIGPRSNYILATCAFGLGSLICGLAVNMPIMLVGRAVQGLGAGLLMALSYGMVRLIFPQNLWPRAISLVSGVWGVATLIGPAIGGVFAQLDAWRFAFILLVPLAFILCALSMRVIPRHSDERGVDNVPVLQVGLVVGAVLLISVASVQTANPALALALTLAAVLAIIWLGYAERHSDRRLLPTGTFTAASVIAPLFATMLLLQLSITSDVFVPLFLQRLHAQPPLMAGYLVALLSLGWTTGSMLLSGQTGNNARAVLVGGPIAVGLAAIGLALFMARDNASGDLLLVLPVAASLLLLGLGIGSAWPHLLTRLMAAAPEGEKDITSAAISMVQLFASGFGAALGGTIVNLAGLSEKGSTQGAIHAANWLYSLFALVPIIAIGTALIVVRRANQPEGQLKPS